MQAGLRAFLFSLVLPVAGALSVAGMGADAALAQSPPSFQQYPLKERLLGPGGALFPNYSNPSELGIAYVLGRGTRRNDIFAAGTVDFNCQQTEAPQIRVLSTPPRGQVSIRLASFRITGFDAGLSKCLGQSTRGMVVSYRGPRAPGAIVRLRVIYPTLGAWYDHDVPVNR
ncbi:hypothetical protein ACT6QH_01480 [Xanthobacter sp. TB0139]|uniref:hypothetical protein n=1 Tax=Xanthobacter sp. TB0139 TaxID=3459178 RepID=UPI004039C8D8